MRNINVGKVSTSRTMQRKRLALGVAASLLCATSGAMAASLSIYNGKLEAPRRNEQPSGSLCGPLLLNQNTSQVVANGVVCGLPHPNLSFLRAFSLGTFPTGFSACSVNVGIAIADAAGVGTTQPLTVRIYSNTGNPFPGGTRTEVGSSTVQIADISQPITIEVPVTGTVPAGAELVAEVFTPDGSPAGHQLAIGANSAGQSGPSYVQSADCGLPNPVTLASLGLPNSHIVLSVRGDVGAPVGFDCSQLGNIVGQWGLNSNRCGNFTSPATVPTYESAIYDEVAPGEYSYEVEFISTRPRQPSATTSLLVNGSPYPLQTATQNWNRAIAFNISGNGKYSIFRYNGSGLPVALQKWVTPVGVAINAAPTPNILRVERVLPTSVAAVGLKIVSTYNLVFSINGVVVQTLPEPFPADQFGVGFIRGIPTTVLGPNDSLEVLNVELGAPMQRAAGHVETSVSEEQQRANNAANRQLGNDNPQFAPDSSKR